MAVMIPDRIPSRASAGEKKVFSILQRLDDDHVVYYEPIIEDRYPDFVLISPDLGLMVIEVKGWYIRDILGGDTNNIQVKEKSGVVVRNHPTRQARNYMFDLMNRCQNSVGIKRLIQQKGNHANKLICPMAHMSILSNITQEQLSADPKTNLTVVFDEKRVLTRDRLLHWEEELHDSVLLIEELKKYFDPWWDFPRLREDQMDAFRAIIHPEIIINISAEVVNESEENSDLSDKDVSLKVLDLKQEENARNIGSGHRIIYGVAGSGKTVLLVARARLISQQSPDAQILFLCFNVSLSAYLKSILTDYKNITVLYFDGWAKNNGVVRQKIGDQLEDNDTLGEKLLAKLQEGTPDSRKYDLVLIDEAQDFAPSWFKCVLEAMQEPNDGDLIIVGDGSQGLYRKRQFSWKDIGINAQGRTVYRKFDLDKNYRNCREILELAALFANENDGDAEDGIASLRVDPSLCTRSAGIKPVLLKSSSIEQECSKVVNIVRDLLSGEWFSKKIDKLNPKDIGIFYRSFGKRKEEVFKQLISNLEEFTQVVWLTKRGDNLARTRVSEDAVKIQTIHSAKGLQYPAVIILSLNDMPSNFGDSSIETEKSLCYVAMTRAETYLAISSSRKSDFVEMVENSGKVDFK